MTSDFDSFDESLGGVRTESTHKVFNTGSSEPWDGHVVAIVFIDESCGPDDIPFGYTDRNCDEEEARSRVFDAHIANWQDLQDARYSSPTRQLRGGVMHVGVWLRDHWAYRSIVPQSRFQDTFSQPDPVFLVHTIRRLPQAEPDLAAMQAFLNLVAAPITLRGDRFAVLILMDESASLTRDALEGENNVFSNFLSWIRARPDVTGVGFLDNANWVDERWVGEVTDQLSERIGV
ncbi:hypothetical protein LCGC14_0943210 [marine sediment metagenome]|uniref:Uncharacterized protein n=1 Tax=marine sediment metagenome TaxID=412755 RepID=A0A0F9P5G9_9ZZZZ